MTNDQKTEFLAELQIGKKKGGTLTEWLEVDSYIVGSLMSTGRELRTTTVMKIHTLNKQRVAETLNSYYILQQEYKGNEKEST